MQSALVCRLGGRPRSRGHWTWRRHFQTPSGRQQTERTGVNDEGGTAAVTAGILHAAPSLMTAVRMRVTLRAGRGSLVCFFY